MFSLLTKFSVAIAFFVFPAASLGQSQGPPPKYFNERFVIKAMAKLAAAQATYQATTGGGNYGTFTQLRKAGLIDDALGHGSKYGYIFTMTIGSSGPAQYLVNAAPVSYRKTGLRSYFIDQRGVLWGADLRGLPANQSNAHYIDTCALFGLNENERCTIEAMRTLHSAEMTYAATVGNGQYGMLPQLYNAGLIDLILGGGLKHGYTYFASVTAGPPSTFRISSTPVQYGITGLRSFFIDQTGILRGANKNGSPADENDPPINQ